MDTNACARLIESALADRDYTAAYHAAGDMLIALRRGMAPADCDGNRSESIDHYAGVQLYCMRNGADIN
jgi:hypothetical protein